MRFALGMDNREIARALGRTDGATKVLLHRAIQQLEEIVAGGANGRRGGDDASAPTDFEALLRAGARAGRAARASCSCGSRRRWLELTELAADELEAWELVAMRDPRNWAAPRPPGRRRGRRRRRGASALVVLRTQRQRAPAARRSRAAPRDLAERTLRDAGARGARSCSTTLR